MLIGKPVFYIIATTAVKALNGLAVIKILALSINPTEFGRMTQIMSIIALFGMLAAGGIGNGLTRQLSNYEDCQGRERWLKAAIYINLLISAFLSIIIFASSWSLANWLIGDNNFTIFFIFLAISQVFLGAFSLTQAIAAAVGQYLYILKITVFGSILGVLIVGILTQYWGAIGGAVALVLNAALPGLIVIILNRKMIKKNIILVNKDVNWSDILLLLKFASVTLLGAISLTFAQIATRDYMGEVTGWETVGLWQCIVRISDVYMQLASIYITSFILPRLSAHNSYASMNKKFTQFVIFLSSIFIVMSIIIYLMREFIIKLLFSNIFLEASELVLPQLVGDLFRLYAVCLSVAMFSRSDKKISMVFEASQGPLLFVLTVIFASSLQEFAPLIAHIITYLILSIALLFSYYRFLSKERII